MSEEKKPERYNTVFLVSQIQETQARNKKIGIAVAVVLGLVIIWALFIKQPSHEEPEHGGGFPSSAPAAAPSAAPAAPAPAPEKK